MSLPAELLRTMTRAVGLLVAVAVAGVAVVSFTHLQTREHIETRQHEQTLRQLDAVLPAAAYTNNPAEETVSVDDRRLGTDQPVTVYRARRNGDPVAVILPVTAPDGYSGPIELLVAIRADGSVAGVRVLNHRETPGLGDAIESDRSDWLEGFDHRSLGDPPREDWTVARRGGEFDGITGATITARAVVQAVARALDVFEDRRDELLITPQEPAPP